MTYFDILRRKIIHSVNLSENFGIFNCWSDFSITTTKKDCLESSLFIYLLSYFFYKVNILYKATIINTVMCMTIIKVGHYLL